MMKKVLCIILAILFVLPLAGCGSSTKALQYTEQEIAQKEEWLKAGKSYITKHLQDKYGFTAELKTSYVITQNPSKVADGTLPKYLPIVFTTFLVEGKYYKAYADLQSNPVVCYDNYEIDEIRQKLADFTAETAEASFRSHEITIKSVFKNSHEITETTEVLNKKFTTVEDLLNDAVQTTDSRIDITLIGTVFEAKSLNFDAKKQATLKKFYAFVLYNTQNKNNTVVDNPLSDDCFKYSTAITDFYRDGTLFASENRWTGYKKLN